MRSVAPLILFVLAPAHAYTLAVLMERPSDTVVGMLTYDQLLALRQLPRAPRRA